MAKREAISAVDFVKVFAPMAKQGKSALEIGQALGMTGDKNKIAIAVSVKASQLRKRLKDAAVKTAATQGLDTKATKALVQTMEDKLPKIKSRGRKGEVTELVSAIDNVLATLDAPAEQTEAPAEQTEVPAEQTEAPAEQTEAPAKSRKGRRSKKS